MSSHVIFGLKWVATMRHASIAAMIRFNVPGATRNQSPEDTITPPVPPGLAKTGSTPGTWLRQA